MLDYFGKSIHPAYPAKITVFAVIDHLPSSGFSLVFSVVIVTDFCLSFDNRFFNTHTRVATAI